jgi:signal peptidase I
MQEQPIVSYSNNSDRPADQPGFSSPPGPQKRRSKEGWKNTISTLIILIAAPLVAVMLTSFVFQSYEVDGPSMESTLDNRDRLIVWKMPHTVSRLTNHDYIPSRGDIVVFTKHGLADFGERGDKQLIKRVIGLPGDRVVVRDGAITLYNEAHPDGYNPDTTGQYKLDEGQATAGNVDITVPEGEVFVSGDNRMNSLDSRAFGTVPSKDLVGELTFRIFPFNKAKHF